MLPFGATSKLLSSASIVSSCCGRLVLLHEFCIFRPPQITAGSKQLFLTHHNHRYASIGVIVFASASCTLGSTAKRETRVLLQLR